MESRSQKNDAKNALNEMSALEYLIKRHEEQGNCPVIVDALKLALHRCWVHHCNIVGVEVFRTLKYHSNPGRAKSEKWPGTRIF